MLLCDKVWAAESPGLGAFIHMTWRCGVTCELSLLRVSGLQPFLAAYSALLIRCGRDNVESHFSLFGSGGGGVGFVPGGNGWSGESNPRTLGTIRSAAPSDRQGALCRRLPFRGRNAVSGALRAPGPRAATPAVAVSGRGNTWGCGGGMGGLGDRRGGGRREGLGVGCGEGCRVWVGTRGEKGNGTWGWKKGRREGRTAVMLALGPAAFLIRSHALKARLTAFVSMEIKL